MRTLADEDRFRDKVSRYMLSLKMARSDQRRVKLIHLLAEEAAKAKQAGWARLHP